MTGDREPASDTDKTRGAQLEDVILKMVLLVQRGGRRSDILACLKGALGDQWQAWCDAANRGRA